MRESYTEGVDWEVVNRRYESALQIAALPRARAPLDPQ